MLIDQDSTINSKGPFAKFFSGSTNPSPFGELKSQALTPNAPTPSAPTPNDRLRDCLDKGEPWSLEGRPRSVQNISSRAPTSPLVTPSDDEGQKEQNDHDGQDNHNGQDDDRGEQDDHDDQKSDEGLEDNDQEEEQEHLNDRAQFVDKLSGIPDIVDLEDFPQPSSPAAAAVIQPRKAADTLPDPLPSKKRRIIHSVPSPPPSRKAELAPQTLNAAKAARAYELTLRKTLIGVAEAMGTVDGEGYRKLCQVYNDGKKAMADTSKGLKEDGLMDIVWPEDY